MKWAFFLHFKGILCMRWNDTFQHEAKKVKRYWLECGNFATHQWSNKFKCNATRLCNLPILTSQNMAHRTSILTLHIGNRRISYHAEKNRSNSSVSNTGLRFGDCLCNVSFFFQSLLSAYKHLQTANMFAASHFDIVLHTVFPWLHGVFFGSEGIGWVNVGASYVLEIGMR